MKLLLFIIVPLFSFSQTYTVEKVNGITYARPASNYPAFSGKDEYTVIQSAINYLTQPVTQGAGGGWIYIRGQVNLSNELSAIGWEKQNPPFSQLIISGDGYSTKIFQYTADKNAIVVKNRASVVIKDLFIGVGSKSLSGILLDDTGSNSEISVMNGTIDNVKIVSSGKAPGLYAKNFFSLNIQHIDVINTENHGILLQGTSKIGINYGNCNFGFISSRGSILAPFSGLAIISDVVNHPIGLMHFSDLNIGSGYYGLYMRGAVHNTFSLVDIEYMSKPIYLDSGYNIETTGNTFLSGYLYPNKNGTAITCAEKTANNKFLNIYIESDDISIIPVLDFQKWRVPNKYDLTFGGNVDEKKIIVKSPLTPFSYTKVSDGIPVIIK